MARVTPPASSEQVETTGGGEATTHVSEELRLAGYGRHRQAVGPHLVTLRSFQAEKSTGRLRVGGPIYQDRFGSKLLCQPLPAPPQLATYFAVVELFVARFGPSSQQATVKRLVHKEGKVRHLGGCRKIVKDGPVLRDVWEVEGSVRGQSVASPRGQTEWRP